MTLVILANMFSDQFVHVETIMLLVQSVVVAAGF